LHQRTTLSAVKGNRKSVRANIKQLDDVVGTWLTRRHSCQTGHRTAAPSAAGRQSGRRQLARQHSPGLLQWHQCRRSWSTSVIHRSLNYRPVRTLGGADNVDKGRCRT